VANSKSAEKRIRVNERRRVRNQRHRSESRTLLKKAQVAIEGGVSPDTDTALIAAIRKLDQTANKGIIHKNAAARRKSRLMARYNKAAGIGKAAQQESE
jgi:small subunit ribosomal protein S20